MPTVEELQAQYSGTVYAPGPQLPGNYPVPVGANYLQFGEQTQNGYVYDPFNDRYVRDPKLVEQYEIEQGFREPKPKKPGLGEQILPIAGAAAAGELGSQIIRGEGFLTKLPEALGKIPDTLGGLFGSGGATTATAPMAGAASLPTPQIISATQVPAAAGAAVPAGLTTAPAGVGVGAGGAGVPAAPTGLMGSLGPAAGIAAGAVTGALQVQGGLRALEGKRMSLPQKVALALPTFGLSLVWDDIKSAFGSKDKWKTEREDLESLQKEGVFVPENLLASMPTGGRSKEELIREDLAEDFVGFDENGNWVNNKFANSRDEKDLVGTDIVNYAAFAKKYSDWFERPLEERIALADRIAALGAVKEHHGTIDIDWKKVEEAEDVELPTPEEPQVSQKPGMMGSPGTQVRAPQVTPTPQAPGFMARPAPVSVPQSQPVAPPTSLTEEQRKRAGLFGRR